MHLTIYRSVTHVTYPDEAMIYCYSFQPIHAEELDRAGLLLSWTDDSGIEPFAVIEAPDDARIAQTEDGWILVIPERPAGIDIEDLYALAVDDSFGLSVVREPRADGRSRLPVAD